MVNSSKDEIKELIKKINEAWVKGDAGQLGQFFHRDMVIFGPDLRKVCNGREECVKGYIDFCDNAGIMTYNESNFVVDVWGNTAAVVYDFEIGYEMEGKRYDDAGRDLFIFSRDGNDGEWLAVWRILVAAPRT
ncbi:MAG: nuclear transport factor 2 family protein [Candidatus Zixiibacteriota bacterium]|nr:MAG: nuclear transport factor 2 family protein [candidate division Zixibacteria bacterium]